METWAMGVGLRPGRKLPDWPPNPNVVMRHSSIPTTIALDCERANDLPTEYVLPNIPPAPAHRNVRSIFSQPHRTEGSNDQPTTLGHDARFH